MRLRDITKEVLEGLAERVGTAAGKAQAETLLAHEESLAQVSPPTPVEQAASNLLAEIPGWAEEAARVPRAVGSKQAALLTLAIAYRQALKEQQREEGGATT